MSKTMKAAFCALAVTASSVCLPHMAKAQLNYKVSWIGNSFGKNDSGKWVQNNIAALYVAPNGTCYTNSNWDEAKHEGGIYKNGDVIGTLADMHDYNGQVVTGDGTYVYASHGNELRRYNPDGSRGNWTVDVGGYIMGLSVDKTNNLIYCSSDKAGAGIQVYNLATLALVRSWAMPTAGRTAIASDGSVWMVQWKSDTVVGKVVHYSSTGTLLSQSIVGGTSNPGFNPADLCFDGSGRLMVADNGPDQQVKIYTNLGNTAPTLGATFGAKGGIFSGTTGAVAPLKFNGLTGVGVDSTGNIYVSQNRFGPQNNGYSTGGGSILESYTAAGARNWQLLGLEFVDCGDATPGTDGAEIYTKYSRYAIDFSKTAPGSEWTYKAHTLNQFKYPDDTRFQHRMDNGDFTTGYQVRVIGGKKFQFNTSMQGTRLEVYRFNAATDGEIAIPCGELPISSGSIWRDLNGNGLKQNNEWAYAAQPPSNNGVKSFQVDSNGDIWQAYPNGSGPGSGVRRLIFQGLDSNGSPKWDTTNSISENQPAPFSELWRAEYMADTDTMYLAGFATSIDPNHHYQGVDFNSKGIGSVLGCYPNWKAGNRVAKWTQIMPDYYRTPTSLAVAGDYVFVGYDGLSSTPDSGYVRVTRVSDGVDIGLMWAGPPAFNGESNLGRMDIEFGVRAFKRANGEYIVLTEEDWYGRVMMYRWTPGSSGGPNLVTNPGFESEQFGTQTPSGWSEWSSNNGYSAGFTEGAGAGNHSGNFRGTHYSTGAYNLYTYQVKSGLANGLYTLRTWARSKGTQSACYLEAKDFDGTTLRANLPTTSTWTQVSIPNINVTNGNITFGIWSNANAGDWCGFDDFEFFKQ